MNYENKKLKLFSNYYKKNNVTQLFIPDYNFIVF